MIVICTEVFSNLQQTTLIPNFSTRTETDSVRQKVGIKNVHVQNVREELTVLVETMNREWQ